LIQNGIDESKIAFNVEKSEQKMIKENYSPV